MSDNPQANINVNIGGSVLGTVLVAGGNITYQYIERPDPGIPYLAPPLPPHHVPREAELAELRHLLVQGSQSVAVTALRGMGGIGKTTLAIALCHDQRIVEHFTDGVLWANLGPEGDPSRAQAQWLDAFGISPADVPDPESRAARLRTILHSKKCLLVIDDVWDSAALPLLQVGGSGCATLVTTRVKKIAQKVGTARELGILNPDQAIAILEKWAGGISEGQIEAASELAKRLGYLPLALALAGAQAQDGKSWNDLLTALRNTQGDITLLDLDDPKLRDESLELTFRLSIDRLEAPLPERFYMLGVFAAGNEAPFDAAAVAAVWRVDAGETEKLLSQLTQVALLGRIQLPIYPNHEYFTLHLLLGDYARGSLLTSEMRTELEKRHRAYYFEIAKRSNEDWAEAEASLTQIHAVWERLASDDIDGWYSWAMELDKFLKKRGLWAERSALFEAALKLVKIAHDRPKEARCLHELAFAANALGHLTEALHRYTDNLALYREVGDHSMEASTLSNIGSIYQRQGDLTAALDYYRQSIALRRELGDRSLDDRSGEATTFNNMGLIYQRRGNLNAALDHYEQSLVLHREVRDIAGEAVALNNLGSLYRARGELSTALDFYEQSLNLRRKDGNRKGEAESINNIALVYSDRGDLITALAYYEQSLALSREVGDNAGEALIGHNLAMIYCEQGRLVEAIRLLEISVTIDEQMGLPYLDSDRAELELIRAELAKKDRKKKWLPW